MAAALAWLQMSGSYNRIVPEPRLIILDHIQPTLIMYVLLGHL